jgi:hypothetical protein
VEPSEHQTIQAICEKCGKAWTERVKLAGDTLTYLDQAPAAPFTLQREEGTGRVLKFLFSVCEQCEPNRIAEVRLRAATVAKRG